MLRDCSGLEQGQSTIIDRVLQGRRTMLGTVNMHPIRRASLTLCAASVVALLGACSHPRLPGASEPDSWTVENVAGKTTAELTARVVGQAAFERSSSQVIDGYTVESGKLRIPGKAEGSLVTVRSSNGSLTALINSPEKSGSLHVDSKGLSRFVPQPAVDKNIEDAVTHPSDKVATAPVDSSAAPQVIDILMGYSRAGVDRAGGDANADALAKVEYVNLNLRNSLVTNVSFKLAGIQIVEPNYLVSVKTLSELPVIFAEGMANYHPDVIYGNFGSLEPGGAVGWAYTGGRTALGVSHSHDTFAHELGHVTGSSHCNTAGAANYRFGYDNGKSGTQLCGRTTAYYSEPSLRDEFSLPRGNAVTADTARVWRENAVRLATYSANAATNFRKTGSTITKVTFGWNPSNDAVRYDIYRETPSNPQPHKIAETASLTYTASDSTGRTMYFVKAVNSAGIESKPSNKASR